MMAVYIQIKDFEKFQAGGEVECKLGEHGWFELRIEVPIGCIKGRGAMKSVKLPRR